MHLFIFDPQIHKFPATLSFDSIGMTALEGRIEFDSSRIPPAKPANVSPRNAQNSQSWINHPSSTNLGPYRKA